MLFGLNSPDLEALSVCFIFSLLVVEESTSGLVLNGAV
jgi:hypothetical protein